MNRPLITPPPTAVPKPSSRISTALVIYGSAIVLLLTEAIFAGCSIALDPYYRRGVPVMGKDGRLPNATGQRQIPLLRPVPGHHGLYTGPGEPQSALIDCGGMASGTIILSPYTQRQYRVP